MKYLLLSLLSLNIFAVDHKCHDLAVNELMKFEKEYSAQKITKNEFLQAYDLVFSCKTRKAPHREVFQYGDGSGLMGVEYKIIRGKCVLTEGPYAGQDDQDLDLEWFKETCQEADEIDFD